MQNRAGKKQKYICKCRAVKCLAAVIQRGMAAALVFVLCFFMAFTMPIQAASGGTEHHEDTLDYCLRAHDVTVNMTELQGLDDGQKKALVENASGYAFYTWRILYRAWQERVSGSGDFSGVNWEQEGSYKITVRMPALSDGVVSEVSYTLTIVDDLPEPEPPAPVTYRVTVRFLDEETGEPLKEDFVSDEIEEGAPFEIGADILLLPEGYTVAEIQGDLAGKMTSDREILVICRKREAEVQEPADPENPDGPGGEGEGNGEESGDVTGITDGDHSGSGDSNGSSNAGGNSGSSHNSGSNSNNNSNSGKTSGKNSGKNSGKTSGSSKGSSSGRTGSGSSSSGSKASAGQTTKTPSAAAQAAAQTAAQNETPAGESQIAETSPAEETAALAPEESALPAEEVAAPEAELPEAEAVETVPAPVQEAADGTSTALAAGENEGGQEALGGAVIPQAQAQKEKFPLWSTAVGVAEAGVLAVLSCMIFSDLKLIMWFEKKKRR